MVTAGMGFVLGLAFCGTIYEIVRDNGSPFWAALGGGAVMTWFLAIVERTS